MKILNKLSVLTSFTIAIGGLMSCSNEINDGPINSPSQNNGSVLVRNPEIIAWSGDAILGNFNTRAEEEEENEPAAITPEEIEAAKTYFNALDNHESPTGGEDLEITDLNGWKNYYVQQVVSGNKIPLEVAQFVGTNNEEISNIAIWSIDPEEVEKILKTDAYSENEDKYLLDLDDPELVSDHPIKDISFETTGYDINNTYYENVRCASKTGQYYLSPNYRIARIKVDAETQVDADDGVEVEEPVDAVYVALYGFTNQNNGFWDRIIKITKIEGEEGGDQNSTVIGSDKILHNNEVEINLSLLDTHDNYSVEDLISKLSIHVRYPKDVKVRIPVPVETLVPADDLAIVLTHKDHLENYGKEHQAKFEINGHEVELNVAFTEAQDCAGNGFGYYIEVTTLGINRDVFEFCQKTYGDGVNFEVYNYYQWNVTDDEGNPIRIQPTEKDIESIRKKWLNKSTVEFGYYDVESKWNAYTNSPDCPYYYINAFNNDRNRENAIGEINEMDCTVKVISNQDYYENSYTGNHLNGSEYNIIYIRYDIFGTELQDDAHTKHTNSVGGQDNSSENDQDNETEED